MLFTLYSLKRLPGGNETVGDTIFCLKCGFLYKKLKIQMKQMRRDVHIQPRETRTSVTTPEPLGLASYKTSETATTEPMETVSIRLRVTFKMKAARAVLQKHSPSLQYLLDCTVLYEEK